MEDVVGYLVLGYRQSTYFGLSNDSAVTLLTGVYIDDIALLQ